MQIPITAIGISLPYLDIAPYLASIILQTSDIITIDIWVINVDTPSFTTFSKIEKSILKLFSDNLNVLLLKKYANDTINDTIWPITRKII